MKTVDVTLSQDEVVALLNVVKATNWKGETLEQALALKKKLEEAFEKVKP